MEALSRSWHLTRLSFRVLKQDREMLLFPLLGGIFSLLYSLAILVPTVIMSLKTSGTEALTAIDYVASFLTYLGLAFIATFFNTCTVYTTKVRFEGGDATFKESLGFAWSRIGLIFKWSLVAATVGLILRLLDQIAERIGGVGESIMNVLTSLVGMAWSVVTLFVVPAMVYHGVGPMDAVRMSTETLKKTWGESLARHFGLGFIQGAFILLGALAFAGLASAVGDSGLGITAVIILGLTYFIGIALIFSVMNAVFNTALFVYARTGVTPGEFDHDTMEHAFRKRRRR